MSTIKIFFFMLVIIAILELIDRHINIKNKRKEEEKKEEEKNDRNNKWYNYFK